MANFSLSFAYAVLVDVCCVGAVQPGKRGGIRCDTTTELKRDLSSVDTTYVRALQKK